MSERSWARPWGLPHQHANSTLVLVAACTEKKEKEKKRGKKRKKKRGKKRKTERKEKRKEKKRKKRKKKKRNLFPCKVTSTAPLLYSLYK